MTRIRLRYGRDTYSVSSKGHAGTSQICTAVSALIQALAGWALNTDGGTAELEKGNACVVIPKSEGAAAVMDLMTVGLLQIRQAAPDDVNVEIVCEE